MVEFILRYGCSICPKQFTTTNYAQHHIRECHHKEAPIVVIEEPIKINLTRGPGINGVMIDRCPKHRGISLGIKARHDCYSPMFLCNEGCIFCRKCKTVARRSNIGVEFPGNMIKSWKRVILKKKPEVAEA